MTLLVKKSVGDLAKYDPQKGLLKISVLEGLEDRFRRAKDPSGLMKAIQDKMTEQRNFVLWWDAQVKHKGGRPDKNPSQISKGLTVSELGTDYSTIHRWRRLKDEEKFEEELAAKQSRSLSLIEYDPTNVLAQKHTGEQENYTPGEIIEAVRSVLGSIDLDPASCAFAQRIVKAKKYFTQEDDGLTRPWYGNVFVNPPYQMPLIREFTDKLMGELPSISSAILLTNNNTDTLWFHKCANKSIAVCFTKGRINFYKTDTEKTYPTNGQAFFYFGNNFEAFNDVFSKIGLIMKSTHMDI